jgi:hypothetical protein
MLEINYYFCIGCSEVVAEFVEKGGRDRVLVKELGAKKT